MKTLLLLILLLTSSSFPLFGQTKVWEATSPTTIDYLAISHDGTTLAIVYGDSLYIWRTSDTSFMKKVVFTINSNPTISRNNEKVYCSGIVDKVVGLYTIPINEDTLYYNKLIEFKNYLSGGNYVTSKGFWTLKSCYDTNNLFFGYQYGTANGYLYSLGRIGLMSTDAKQLSNYSTNSFNHISYNQYTNWYAATGNSRVVKLSGGPNSVVDNPNLSVYSIPANTIKYTTQKEFSSIGACRDSNYVFIEGQLFHFPSNDYLRSFPTSQVGSYHSNSFNKDFFLGIKGAKGDTITIVRYDRDTAELKIYCGGTINNCQLSADSRRIAVITNGKLITVYELPEIVEEASLHVDFTSNFKKPYKGGSIQFRNNSYVNDSKYKLLWEFGDGDTSSLVHPTHTYSIPGKYTVRLTIMTSKGDSASLAKTEYIIYEDVSKPIGALWAKKYINAGITALTFVKDSIFAGTNDGSIFSVYVSGIIGEFVAKNMTGSYSFVEEYKTHTNVLHFKNFAYNENTSDLYVLGIPKGTSSFAFLYKYNPTKGIQGNFINIGTPGYKSQNVGVGSTYYESDKGGNSSLDINYESAYLHYANYGFISFSWITGPPPYKMFSGSSDGNYVGTLLLKNDSIVYDNGRYPTIYSGIAPNPSFLKDSENLSLTYVRSIRSGLPYNPTSFFVITLNSVYWIRYGTFNRISKFPTLGDILRHSPDQYHSFTSDGVWSFADGKRLDSLPLLSARSFEVFPDGVHLLVMYPKSDTVAIFNTLTKKYTQFFKANFIISSIAISKDGKSFATGDTGGIVTLWQTPKLSITKKIEFFSPHSDKNHVKGDTVQFFNTSIPVNSGCRYEWDFGDGTTSNERLPKHVYGKAGKYTVTLKTYCPPETGVDSTVDVLEKAAYITVTDTVTSVEGQEKIVPQSHLIVTPNPLVHQGLITVNFPQPEQYSLRIITLLGQEILLAEDALSSHEEYAIPQLPRGVYTCQLRFGNGEIISQPFVVSE